MPEMRNKKILDEVRAQTLRPLLESLHVLLAGGDSSHIGAVGMACFGKLLHSWAFPGHREQVVCKEWAARLSAVVFCNVTVACGIHYDNASKEQIDTIVTLSRAMLEMVIEQLKDRQI